jgi:YebC/PmpR family DNA-binding regulatory protein
MAGHSKWNNIKNRKGAVDKKRASSFSQVSKIIRVAVKDGGSGDPKFNPALRVALDKARSLNMPNSNIDRAIERGLGKTASGTSIQEIVYEGFGPGGVAMLVVAMTDNPNRTAADIKFAFSRGGGSLGGPGTAMYMFERDKDGYKCTMPMTIDEDSAKKLDSLVEKIRESEDVEDVYLATNTDNDN